MIIFVKYNIYIWRKIFLLRLYTRQIW